MSKTFYNTLIISNVLLLLIWTPMLYRVIKWEVKNFFRSKQTRVPWDGVDRFSYSVILFAYVFFWLTFYFLIINY